MQIDMIEEAHKVFDTEIESLVKIKNEIDTNFIDLIQMILHCEGKIVFTGMGKSGHIARKISSTMASLGISSFFVHPGEGAHGDLGMITNKDIIIVISNSGETDEIVQLLPSISIIGSKLVSITGEENSTIGKCSEINIILKIIKEASQYELAPTTSTTAALVFGDALAVVLSKIMGFDEKNFALFHPKGTLGKKLLITVGDLMHSGKECPSINVENDIKQAIIEISAKGLGAIGVVDQYQNLVGIITDGDLRRGIELNNDIISLKIKDIMTKEPITTMVDEMAINALKIMQSSKRHIMVLPVIDKFNKLVGMIRINDIVKAGIKE